MRDGVKKIAYSKLVNCLSPTKTHIRTKLLQQCTLSYSLSYDTRVG